MFVKIHARRSKGGQTAVNLVFLLVYTNIIISIVIGVSCDRVIMGRKAQSKKVSKGTSGSKILNTSTAIAKAVDEAQTSQSETFLDIRYKINNNL